MKTFSHLCENIPFLQSIMRLSLFCIIQATLDRSYGPRVAVEMIFGQGRLCR